MPFLYVFSKEDAEKLTTLGYKMVQEDKSHERYVFLDREGQTFSESGFRFVRSDILTL